MRLTAMLSVAMIAGASAACGSFAPPNEKLTEAEAAVRSAREVGAPEVPRASLHLRLAEEQLDKARNLMAREEFQRADLALTRAKADAELAIAVSKGFEVEAETKAAQDKVAKLRAALGR